MSIHYINSKERVAIVGVGAISCLGLDRSHIADALYHGKSGIIFDPERKNMGFRSCLTAAIPRFDPNQYLSQKLRKTMTLSSIQSYAAVVQAIEQAGLDFKDLQNERTGLIFGCDSSCIDSYDQAAITYAAKSTSVLGSGHVFRSMTSNVTMNLNVLLRTQGACWTISAACSSSGHAVGQAFDLIRNGRQDCIVCGGAQEINWQSMCGFDSLDAFSVGNGDPTKAPRPFSHDRDGLVPGGGAAAIILERYDLAQQRGARILGEICGYGFSSDGYNISVPHEEGMRRAMTMALRDSNSTLDQVQYICAHATATKLGDKAEALAINSLFGESKPYVSSLKGMCGHELWMAGAAQVVYTTVMASNGFIAPNINFTGHDEYSRHLNILTETLEQPLCVVLCNAAGFGGTNSSLLIRYEV